MLFTPQMESLQIKFGIGLALALVVSPGTAAASQAAHAAEPSNGKERQMREDVLKRLDSQQKEMVRLEARAGEVTVEIGKLASTGKLSQDQESIKLLQRMVDELKAIRERLDRMQVEVSQMRAWLEGQSKSLPEIQRDLASLKAQKPGNYVQFQFNDTNRSGGAPDAFRMRRVRLGITDTVAPNAKMKITFDLATGTNQLNAQLKDAFLTYAIASPKRGLGTTLVMGQQNVPLGYEISRSSSDREFPERSQYNQVMFGGERGRGVLLEHGIAPNTVLHAGIWNALTIGDPEQANLAPGQGNRLAGTAGVRHMGPKHDLGLAAFVGNRPSFTAGSPAATSPGVRREFVYGDAQFIGLLVPDLFLRAEGMIGRDRTPSSSASASRTAHEMYGYHVVLGYNLDPANQLAVRYEEFDPNRDAAGDLFRGWGIAYSHFFGPKVRLTAAHELFQDDARAGAPIGQRRYQTTVIRMQFKF